MEGDGMNSTRSRCAGKAALLSAAMERERDEFIY
jgi:hypothetical protein